MDITHYFNGIEEAKQSNITSNFKMFHVGINCTNFGHESYGKCCTYGKCYSYMNKCCENRMKRKFEEELYSNDKYRVLQKQNIENKETTHR